MTRVAPAVPDFLVTVVVPCGPQGRYVEGLKSIVGSQEIPAGMEFLVVNDSDRDLVPIIGTTRNATIRVIAHDRQSMPQGVSASRNTGLAQARGRYVAFADADDTPFLTEILRLSAQAEAYGAQVGIGAFRRVPSNSVIRRGIEGLGSHSIPAAIASLVGVWRMTFERVFLLEHGLRFGSLSYGEDLLFALDVDLLRPKVLRSRRLVYEYLDDDGPGRLSQRQVDQIGRSELLDRLSVHARSRKGRVGHRLVSAAWAARIRRRGER